MSVKCSKSGLMLCGKSSLFNHLVGHALFVSFTRGPISAFEAGSLARPLYHRLKAPI
jgi:hypothetical protein